MVSRMCLMSLSEADFLRLLPRAIAPFNFSLGSNTVEVTVGEGVAHIAFQPRPAHVLASLSLPVLQVDIRFDNLDEAAGKAFLYRFDQAFHRGGG